MFKLEPCDVLLCINDRGDLFSTLKRWAMGRYEHVLIYLGKAFNDIPMLYESDGRGVVIQNLSHQTGRPVVVLRPKIKNRDDIIANAIEIASKDRSYYDYFAIIRSAAPRLLKEKFPFLPIPSHYVRDRMMICSEAVAEPFWEANIIILPKDIIPLPDDFETSPVLELLNEGKLLEDILP